MKDYKEGFDNIEIPKELDSVIDAALDKAERKRVLRFTKPLIAAACISAIALTLNPILTKNLYRSPVKEIAQTVTEAKTAEANPALPTVDSYENLKKLFASSGVLIDQSVTKEKSDTRMLDSASAKSTADYSTTNNQVSGVEEGDIVKTDGKYIYSLKTNKIVITQAYPAEAMKVVTTLNLGNNFRVRELLLDNNHLIAIGSISVPIRESVNNTADKNMQSSSAMKDMLAPSDTKAVVYDISNKNQAKGLKTIELSGSYVSTRKIGSMLYIISNQYIRDNTLPYYKDSSVGSGTMSIGYDKIGYCPEALTPSYINIASVDLSKINDKAEVTSLIGTGQRLYVSQNNLYIAGHNQKDSSTIYKFALAQGKSTYVCKGQVPGNILNQFSMDEYGDYFRVATTENQFSTKESNSLFILDSSMNIAGKLQNLAPGEQIYSTRFMGSKAYMVTFKTTDPLFVLDLSSPTNPKTLGELKIPGFSTYLQPYDENHIIGFGKDTSEEGGRVTTKGIKLSMFDISDFANPKEKFKTAIGSYGTYSELLSNHKALLFSKEKNIFAFPVTIGYNAAELKLPEAKRMPKDYGLPAFEGAYVFSIDMEKGFILKDTLTHNKNSKNEPKYFSTEEARNNKIQRVLYINNTLYTVSDSMIKANDISSNKELATVRLPK